MTQPRATTQERPVDLPQTDRSTVVESTIATGGHGSSRRRTTVWSLGVAVAGGVGIATLGAVGTALAALVGMSLGLLGGGGSILAVPIFVYALGFEPKPSIAMGLAVVGTTSLFGALRHWRLGNVDLRIALVFGVIAMAGSYGGARLAALLAGTTQLILFAAVMLIAAVFMLRDQPRQLPVVGSGGPRERPAPLSLVAAQGAAVGLLTGLVGVGGGFLIVPALVLLARVPMKRAVGTSLLIIAMNSATGFLGYLGQVAVDWRAMLGFTTVAVAGTVAGSRLVGFVSPHQLRRGFGLLLVGMALFILYRSRAVFSS